jgi:hypothetical protein
VAFDSGSLKKWLWRAVTFGQQCQAEGNASVEQWQFGAVVVRIRGMHFEMNLR